MYYSPTREPSQTSEGVEVSAVKVDRLHEIAKAMQPYFTYVFEFIEDMKKVFPTLKDDWGIYVPEVKYLSPEPLVDYYNLALTKYPNVHFVGCLLYTSPSPRDRQKSRMPSSA